MAGPGTGVLVTGGTGALGRAVVERFLHDGYRVAVTYRNAREWDALVGAQGPPAHEGRLHGFEADLAAEGPARSAVNGAASALGGLAVLIHLAGGFAGGTPVEEIEERTVRGMMDSNLVSAFWTAKHAIPHLKRSGRGRILFISSRGTVETYPGASAYAAAKAGLEALTLTLAKELKAVGVTANALRPSVIDTPANRAAMRGADFDAWVRPESVAGLLAYLASEAAAPVSGAVIPIYGRA